MENTSLVYSSHKELLASSLADREASFASTTKDTFSNYQTRLISTEYFTGFGVILDL